MPALQEIDNKKTAERKHNTRHNNKGKMERTKLHKGYFHSSMDHPSYLVSFLPLKVKIDNDSKRKAGRIDPAYTKEKNAVAE